MAKQGSTIQNQVNLVGEGTVFEGTLRAESDVRASGRVVGKLEVNGKAIVAESGVVEGEVRATNADIAGHVQGEVYVSERLVLKSTARIDGNIETDRLIVEEGAVFTGECRMGQLPETKGSDDAKGASSGTSSSAKASGSASSKASGTKGSGSKPSSASKGNADASGKDSSKGGSAKGGDAKSTAAVKK